MAARKKRGGRAPAAPELTAQQVRFCRHYAEAGNATAAYKAAGFEPCASDEATRQAASTLLTKAHISALVARMRREAADAAMASVDRLAQFLGRVAFGNRADLFGEDGRLLPPGEWPEAAAALVEGVESEELFEVRDEGDGSGRRKVPCGVRHKVKTAKRVEAARLLAQLLGYLDGDRGEKAAGPKPLVVGGDADPDAL